MCLMYKYIQTLQTVLSGKLYWHFILEIIGIKDVIVILRLLFYAADIMILRNNARMPFIKNN